MRKHSIFLALLILTSVLSSNTFAQIPRVISYQGQLLENGKQVDGTYNFDVAIYSSGGSTPIFIESFTGIVISDGVFNLLIGSNEPVPPSMMFDEQYFIGIRVNGGPELPRTPLTSVPYALQAEHARTADALIPGATGIVTSVSSDDATIAVGNADGPDVNVILNDDAVRTRHIVDGVITSAKLADGTVTSTKLSSENAATGTILTADGTGGVAWSTVPSLVLPYSQSVSTDSTAFSIRNSSNGGVADLQVSSTVNVQPALTVGHAGVGSGIKVQLTNAASGARGIDILNAGVGPGLFAAATGGNGVWGLTSSISAAGVIGDNTFGEAIVGRNRGGNGVAAVVGRNDSSGYGVRGFNTKAGIGVLGQAGISGGTGVGGRFENINASNSNDALQAATNGTGRVALLTSANSNNSTAALEVRHAGTGRAGLLVRGGNTNTPTFAGLQVENHAPTGEGAWIRNASATSTAAAIKLHVNPGSSSPILLGTTWDGTNNATNVVRIDKSGKGFFNGGTQNSGADLAEAFAVVGDIAHYEPGDVLTIASGHSRTVERSSEPYSTAVLGVYAIKPGVLLTERGVDADLSDLAPMGVVGVLHTKVSNEGGAIRAGDLLVTSSTPGHAMKADQKKLGFGMVLGKALEDFSGERGTIQVFVNVK
jgi:hypothetical protein